MYVRNLSTINSPSADVYLQNIPRWHMPACRLLCFVHNSSLYYGVMEVPICGHVFMYDITPTNARISCGMDMCHDKCTLIFPRDGRKIIKGLTRTNLTTMVSGGWKFIKGQAAKVPNNVRRRTYIVCFR